MADITVGSGQTSSGLTLSSGDTLTVLSGGTASATKVNSGATETVFGRDVSATISGGAVLVSSGGTASGDVLTGNGVETVFAGGVASGTTIQQIGGGGSEIVLGSAVGTVLDAGSQTVSSGGVASGTTVFGGTLIVESAGTARGAVLSGGSETVRGTDIGAQLIGGQMFVSSGGTVSNASVGTTLTVSSGGLAVSNTIVSGTAAMFVFGTASATTVSAGSLFISSGGSGNASTLTGNSLEVVFAGGVASGTVMQQVGNTGTTEVVLGIETGAVVDAGTLTVSSGGVASGTTLFAGTMEVASGGSGVGTVVQNGVETVFGTETGAKVTPGGGALNVSSGGTVSGATVFGALSVASGGLSVSTTIDFAGGQETVLGTASATTVSAGSLVVASGGRANGTALTGNGREIVSAGGVASGTVLQQVGNSGASETVFGTETGAVVDAGTLTVSAGGVASGTTLFAGTMEIASGGHGFSTIVENGVETVFGTETGAVVTPGGGALNVSSGGTVSGATVSGILSVASGGLSVSTTIAFGGGQETVLGTASATTVSAGLLVVSSGGRAVGTALIGHGQDIVSAGGVASGTTMGQTGNLGTSEIVFGTAISTSIDAGSQTVSSGGVASGTTLIDGGTQIVASGGMAVATTMVGTGNVELQAGAKVSDGITFSGPGGRLQIDGTAAPQGLVIFGFDPTEIIDLPNIAFDSSGNAVIEPGNVLHISENGSTLDLQLDPDQVFGPGTMFALQNDGKNGTIVAESQPCYCRGTLIAAEGGETPVEQLQIGDRVMTVSGAAQPIKWIGRRSYSGRFALGQKHILPICVRAGALADGVPRRDLWISPNHALYLEGVLIEAADLVNGVSVFQAEQVPQVEYFHIELESHDVLLAEGAAAESFIDDDSRLLFHNAAEYHALYPDDPAGAPRYYAPRRAEGWEVERARAVLAERAGLPTVREQAGLGALIGQVETVGRRLISGWAQDRAHPDSPVCLDIVAGGKMLAQVVANLYRPDLAAAGIGRDGRHGFAFVPPDGLAFAPRSVRVRRSADGCALDRPAPSRRLRATGAARRA